MLNRISIKSIDYCFLLQAFALMLAIIADLIRNLRSNKGSPVLRRLRV